MSNKRLCTILSMVLGLLIAVGGASASGPGSETRSGPRGADAPGSGAGPETHSGLRGADEGAIRLTIERGEAPVWACPDGPVLASPELLHSKPVEDFEGPWPSAGWTVGDTMGGAYRWGARDCHPRTGAKAAWSMGGGTSGASASCASLTPKFQTWAIYGPFTLAHVSDASLHLSVYGQSDGGAGCPTDKLMIGVGTDGQHFEYSYVCGDKRDGPDGRGYYKVQISLNDWAGELEVYISLHFMAQRDQAVMGFMVDDLRVDTWSPGPTATNTPTATATSDHTATPSATGTQQPTSTPTVTRTPSATPTPRGPGELIVLPSTQSVALGQTSYVDVALTSHIGVSGVLVELWYDPDIIEAIDVDAEVAGIQGVAGSLFWGHATTVRANEADNALGRFRYEVETDAGDTVLPTREVVVRLMIRAVAEGRTPVYLINAITRVRGAAPARLELPVDMISGEVYVRPGSVTPEPLGTIRGLVYDDVDGDGAHDPGEPGVGDVTLRASYEAAPGGRTAVTDPDGHYAIENLAANTYVVAPMAMPPEFVYTGAAVRVPLAAGQDVAVAFGLTRVTPMPTNTLPVIPTSTRTASPTTTVTMTPSRTPTLTPSPTPSVTGTPQGCQWMEIMSEDWEAGVSPLTWWPYDQSGTDGGNYLWGAVDHKAHAGAKSIWPAAAGLDALDPATGAYPANLDTWLIYGPFDLSDAVEAELTYWLWLDTDPDDLFFFGAASEFGTFVTDAYYAGRDKAWQQVTLELGVLDDVLGDADVWLGINFDSDEAESGAGPFVDDIVLRTCAPAASGAGVEWSRVRLDGRAPVPPESYAGQPLTTESRR